MLATAGFCTVVVAEGADSAASRNLQRVSLGLNPLFYVSAAVAMSLASELVALLRHLGRHGDGRCEWSQLVQGALYSGMTTALADVADAATGSGFRGASSRASLWHAAASACVMGGFTEPLRLCGRVVVSSGDSSLAQQAVTADGGDKVRCRRSWSVVSHAGCFCCALCERRCTVACTASTLTVCCRLTVVCRPTAP
jgi:hypothetical protein